MQFIKKLSAGLFLSAISLASPVERRDIKQFFTIDEAVPQPLKSGPSALLSTYIKFDKPAPDDIVAAAAANDGIVSADPTKYDSSYLAPVVIGGQTLMLDFDTGSADL